MVRDYFFTEVSIDYTCSADQFGNAEYMVENMVTRKNLDLPNDLELLIST
jgi:hypothetical protein